MNDNCIQIGDWVNHGASGTSGIVRRYCADPRWVWVYVPDGNGGHESPYPCSQLTISVNRPAPDGMPVA